MRFTGPLLIAISLFSMRGACAADISDQRGQRISFDAPAQRIVFLPMPAPSTFIAIDETEQHIVGMNPSSAAAMHSGILGRLFPGIDRIATNVTQGSGVVPNVESILSLHPDAVFQWATSGDDAIDPLDRAGLKVFGMRYGNQDDMEGYLAIMGQVAGKPARASELMQRQERQQAKISAAMGALPEQDRPRVLYVSRFFDAVNVSGGGSYNDFCIRLAGGRNVAASLSGVGRAITLEQILVWDPEVILLGNFDTAMPADLYDDPRWQTISAVRTRRVYRMPLGGYRWDPPSQESALTWAWLAGLLRPDRDAVDLRNDMRDWYRFLYGHLLTDDEIDGILFIKENGGSAGYGRYGRR
jgi:iron complex transport system substrate-binding protein